jgi:peptidoglycan hydrolase-like protein with peptidoglycan-binding domain
MNTEPENVEPINDDVIVDSIADEKEPTLEVADAPVDAPADASSKPVVDAAPAAAATPRRAPVAAAARAVVGKGDTDEVFLSRCVYKSRVTRKSLTVHHLQRRLVELGYTEARTDKDGWYGDHTLLAVKAFQSDRGLSASGIVDADTLVAVFSDDHNVTVVIDD